MPGAVVAPGPGRLPRTSPSSTATAPPRPPPSPPGAPSAPATRCPRCCPSDARWTTPACTSSTTRSSRSRRASPADCTSPAPGWPAATPGGPPRPRRATSPTPSGRPASRMYRTGDMVRWSDDGDLALRGPRRTTRSRSAGSASSPPRSRRGSPAHPAVAEAVVSLYEDGGRKRLAAHLVPAGGADGALGHRAARPSGRRPARLHAARRVRHRAGAAADAPTARSTGGGCPPRTGRPAGRQRLPRPAAPRPSRSLAAIWADLLGVDRVGADDNFFMLGGDSILSIQVVSRARARRARADPARPVPAPRPSPRWPPPPPHRRAVSPAPSR